MNISIATIPVNLSVISGMNVQHEIDNVMLKAEQRANFQMRIIHRGLNKLTSTWRHDPNIQYKIERTSDEISITVWTDDNIFFWVDQGTSIRYATMSKDFVPKTSPGSLRSGVGAGYLDHVDRNDPKPGIEARYFMKTLFDKYEKPFNNRVMKSMASEINRMWASIFRG